ncbi:MAG TPA: YafY family transcriptional regulator [Gammaproteobacteria bacterium]|nr:YafY family transcriptional regulator [Gammaproteobacteria bacterium]
MDKFDRIFELHQLFANRRRPVTLKTIQAELNCSESTVRRAIRLLRDRLGAPLKRDHVHNGYYYDTHSQGPYELPGLWFNAEELHALLVSQHLLDNLQPGILTPHLAPLKQRLQALLNHRQVGGSDIGRRIRILQMATRPTEMSHFRQIASAVLQRRRLRILYHGRARDQTSERTVSPQRLVYYRSNWYLDAHCHWRKELRSFALDRLQPIETLAMPADEISEETLDAHYTESYGIFAGPATHTARLRFSSRAARWVADEQWHPQQQGEVFSDGSYELRIPYSDPRELIMDILKYGPDVKVIAPDELCKLHVEKLRAALDNYIPE